MCKEGSFAKRSVTQWQRTRELEPVDFAQQANAYNREGCDCSTQEGPKIENGIG